MLKLPEEIWKPVLGFEGKYEVSDRGRVRSVARAEELKRFRFGKWDSHTRKRPERIVAQRKNRGNYLQVILWKNGKMYTRTVHRLVLEAFIGGRLARQVTRHLDGNRLNNLPSNLAWGTHQENVQDSIKHGTWQHGEMHARAKLTNADVRAIRKSTDAQRVTARRFGVSQSTVWQIKRGNYWKHVEA